jgi:hypothetical protein
VSDKDNEWWPVVARHWPGIAAMMSYETAANWYGREQKTEESAVLGVVTK